MTKPLLFAVQKTPQVINSVGSNIGFDNIIIKENIDSLKNGREFIIKKRGYYRIETNITNDDFAGIRFISFLKKNDVIVPGSFLVRDESYFPLNVISTVEKNTQNDTVLIFLECGDIISCFAQTDVDNIVINDCTIVIIYEKREGLLYAVQEIEQTFPHIVTNQTTLNTNDIRFDNVLTAIDFVTLNDNSKFKVKRDGYYTVNYNVDFKVIEFLSSAPHYNIIVYIQVNGKTIESAINNDAKYNVRPDLGIEQTINIEKTLSNYSIIKLKKNDILNVVVEISGVVIITHNSSITISKILKDNFIFVLQEKKQPVLPQQRKLEFSNVVYNKNFETNKNLTLFEIPKDGYYLANANLTYNNWIASQFNNFFIHVLKNNEIIPGTTLVSTLASAGSLSFDDSFIAEFKKGDKISVIISSSLDSLQVIGGCFGIQYISKSNKNFND